MKSKRKKLPKQVEDSRTKAAGMSYSTFGRARIFEDKKKTHHRNKGIIKEGLDEYLENKSKDLY
jgi:hypothetical protein